MYTLFAYRLNDKKDAFEKFVIEDIDDRDPSKASTGKEYLDLTISYKRFLLEERNSKIIDEWYAYANARMRLISKLKKLLNTRGFDSSFKSIWEMNDELHGKVAEALLYFYKECTCIYETSENFINSDFFKNAPDDIKNSFEINEEDFRNSHTWLQRMYKTAEEQAKLAYVRPIIEKENYEKFSNKEAKEVIRDILNNYVRCNEDSIADSFKLVFLAISALEDLYRVMPDSSKVKLQTSSKEKIETLVSLSASASSRYNSEYNEKGNSLIKDIIEKENKINEVINSVYDKVKD